MLIPIKCVSSRRRFNNSPGRCNFNVCPDNPTFDNISPPTTIHALIRNVVVVVAATVVVYFLYIILIIIPTSTTQSAVCAHRRNKCSPNKVQIMSKRQAMHAHPSQPLSPPFPNCCFKFIVVVKFVQPPTPPTYLTTSP